MERGGLNTFADKVNAFLCTPDKADTEFQYDVAVSALGDGVRYQADWSPSHTIKHTVTCPKETPKPGATPTPDPTLPLAPAQTAIISSRAANWQGSLVEIVVAVQRSPNVGIGWTWRGGSGYTPFAIDGNTEYYHAYVCTESEAGQSSSYWVRIASSGDGVTYRQGEGTPRELTIDVTCPTAGTTYTPGPAPTPTTSGPVPFPLPPPSTDGTLPLPPAPTNATVTNEPYTISSTYLFDVSAGMWWLDGIASFKVTSSLSFLQTQVTREGPAVATYVNVPVCTADQAGKVLEYDVKFSVFGDGVRYQAAWSPEHTVKHTVACSLAPTPTPDPTLPLAPFHTAGINSRAANHEGKLVEIVVAVARVPNVSIGWSWRGGPGYTLFADDGNTQYYHSYVCTASEAGQHQTFWVRIASFGNGVTYRKGEGNPRELSIIVTCPTSGTGFTPDPTPTPVTEATPTPTPWPTPLPNQEALPLPPVLSVTGLNHEVIEENLKLWLPNRYLVKITWAYTWPNGIAKIEQNDISPPFDLTTGSRPLMQTVDCYPSDAGRSYRYSFKVRAFGDGVAYRAAWGDWSENATISYTCPNPPTHPYSECQSASTACPQLGFGR